MAERDPDAGLALADDECFCVTPTIESNEHGETWCSVCGERLLLDDTNREGDPAFNGAFGDARPTIPGYSREERDELFADTELTRDEMHGSW